MQLNDEPMRAAPADVDEALGVMEALDWSNPATLAPPLSPASKHSQQEIVRTVGERLRAARELCNLSQSAAAKRLGYANPSKLSKVESAADTNSIPLWLIVGAAQLYQVPTDYLFALTEDFEIGVPRGTQPFLLDAWNRMRLRDIGLLDRVHAESVTLSGSTNALVDAVAAVGFALSRYTTNNPGFDDTRGSATLVSAIAKLEAAAKSADAGLKRYQLRTSARGGA